MSISRRQLLGGLAVGASGMALAACGAPAVAPSDTPARYGLQREEFFGTHQAGISTPAQSYAVFTAYDLRPDVGRADMARLMRLLSDDAARMSAGGEALADLEHELTSAPSRLTVTFGFGLDVFAKLGLDTRRPAGLMPIPSMRIDALEQAWSGGDLLVQVCCDDPVVLSHAQRMLWKDTLAFATMRWQQRGFLNARGTAAEGVTGRNLMGQIDGTVNPDAAGFDHVVWVHDGPDWMSGGTFAVIRRIRMDLEKWDQLGRRDRELVIGRRLDSGAPLTGRNERDLPDFTATNADGLTVIPEFAHIRRAHVGLEAPFLRRGYNYDAGQTKSGASDSGLIFCAFSNDIAGRFVPVQRSLAEMDLLNLWTTPIGSAVFAIPGGAQPGGWVGQELLG